MNSSVGVGEIVIGGDSVYQGVSVGLVPQH